MVRCAEQQQTEVSHENEWKWQKQCENKSEKPLKHMTVSICRSVSVPLTPSWRVHMEDPSLLWCCWLNAFKTCYYCFLPCRQGNSATFIFSLSLYPPQRSELAAARQNQNTVLSSCMHGEHKTSGFGCKVMTASVLLSRQKINSDDSHFFKVRAAPGADYSDRSAPVQAEK